MVLRLLKGRPIALRQHIPSHFASEGTDGKRSSKVREGKLFLLCLLG